MSWFSQFVAFLSELLLSIDPVSVTSTLAGVIQLVLSILSLFSGDSTPQ